MADRIYTRLGDAGETSLFGGAKTPKSGLRIHTLGDLDEANSTIGFARAALEPDAAGDTRIDEVLHEIQNRLLDCSAMLAASSTCASRGISLSPEDIAELESFIDDLACSTAVNKHFVLPGGNEKSARLHLARTVIRRAERSIVELSLSQPVDPMIMAYMNRLSDALFIMARCVADSAPEVDRRWTADG